MDMVHPTATASSQLNQAVADLHARRQEFAQLSTAQRLELINSCLTGVQRVAYEWVAACAVAKGTDTSPVLRGEDWLNGPVATVRHLRLLAQVLEDIQQSGRPRLPGPAYVGTDGRVHVPMLPCPHLYDNILFRPYQATVRMLPEVTLESLAAQQSECGQQQSPAEASVTLVLGAGNVSSIPTADTFTKLFQDGQLVLLKMNPVNAYLGPILEQACHGLIERGFLRIIYGARILEPRRLTTIWCGKSTSPAPGNRMTASCGVPMMQPNSGAATTLRS